MAEDEKKTPEVKDLQVYQPAMTMEKAVDIFNQVTKFSKGALAEQVDYGVIPGTEKPTLLKPGAEKLAIWFGLVPDDMDCRVDVLETAKGQLISVRAKCVLRDKNAIIRGISEANCNTGEDRYQYSGKWIPEWELPDDFDISNAEVKTVPKKKGGTFKKYRLKDNQNPWNFYNTVVKMAQKRAFVSAILMATGTSSMFTADLEDYHENSNGVKTGNPTAEAKSEDKEKALDLAFRAYELGNINSKAYDTWKTNIDEAKEKDLPAMIKTLSSLVGEKKDKQEKLV